ncbi:MAG: arginine N-succinyltransferase [unclassified Hahellaceae]|nr:arginine N-succinyltransferase [Hahellaceae bacterium]|tara:strand:- start:46957 stop:48042 length:1086 start_codon:yes stop_codon:yes gene_type:complete
MIIVRPVQAGDQPGIEKLIFESEAPISSLPTDREWLGRRIEQSVQSFRHDAELKGSERFIFVLYDEEHREVLGTAGLSTVAGAEVPFYNYRLDEIIHASKAHGVYNPVQILSLAHDLSNATLLSSFTLANRLKATEYRDLLSRARLLYMHHCRERFQRRCIVEIQGVAVDHGRYPGTSPFWENVGRHFFDIDFMEADQHVATLGKTFIAELMPATPLYLPLLHEEARAVIGLPHEQAAPNMRFLQSQGFELSQYVDIFDAGPVLEAPTERLVKGQQVVAKQVRLSSGGKYASGGQGAAMGAAYIGMNGDLTDFRATLMQMTEGLGDVQRIRKQDADALRLAENDTLFYSRIRPGQAAYELS